MGRGRPRKPLSELKLHGTYKRSRHANRIEDQICDGKPVCPRTMRGDARKAWEKWVRPLAAKGIVSVVDTPLLVGMCEWWARYRALMAAAIESDIEAAGKYEHRAGKAYREFVTSATKVGIGPTDRAKLQIIPEDEEDETEKRFFA